MSGDRDRLILDLDGVAADTMGEVMRQVELETGVAYCHADIVDYWFKGIEHASLFKEIINRAGVFANLEPITGAVRGINRLRERYDDNVTFCTSPPPGSKTAEDEKRAWIARHFDMDMAERAIVTLDKTKVPGRVLIEDSPTISRNSLWSPIIFDQPWNQEVTDLPRMYGWGQLDAVYAAME